MNAVVEHLAQALCSLTRSEKIEVINQLLKDIQYRDILSELPIKKIIWPQNNQQTCPTISDINITSRRKGKKERGKQLRITYISDLQKKGILIEPFDNVWAETAKGLLVALPTATMEWRPGRWFLGLPEKKLLERITKGGVVIILLCQTASNSTLDFIIPPNIVEKIVTGLSKSKGQLKFNVKISGDRYFLVIPDKDDIDISEYQGAISILI